jgi:hypothetical protein
MCELVENYYEDLLFDLDYLEWKREQELRAWCEFVSQKEAEEEAYDIMAQEHFKYKDIYDTQQMDNEYKPIQVLETY